VRRFAALLLFACSGPAAPDPVPIELWGVGAQDALCSWLVACRHVPDDAQCRRNLDPRRYDMRLGIEAVADGRIVYDGVAAARCFEITAGAPCAAFAFSDPTCLRVFQGQVAPGDACFTSRDCADRADCVNRVCDRAQCCAGVCGSPPEPEEPWPEPKQIGESCVTHTDCILDAYCDETRRCVALPDEAGEHCLFGCAWGNLRCDVDTETCVAYQALGAVCADDGECDEAYAYCDGVCRPIPGPGESCDTARRRCIPTAWCDAGTCRARGNPGDPCITDEHCTVGCDEIGGLCVDHSRCPPE
jgi:hypothetical protein